MIRYKPKRGVSSPVNAGGGGGCEAAARWEVRPGGMLVQRRNSDSEKSSNIKVRVKYGSSYHEIVSLSSHANLGELKKPEAGPTGLQENGRDSRRLLDAAGAKDGSKITVIEDELGRERRRRFETGGDEEIERASREISAVRYEVDILAKQVTSIEMGFNGGSKIVEKDLSNLIELLMMQLIKLDGIAADGDVKMQRRVQVKRVQKYIEILDLLKIRNSGVEKTPLQEK